MKENLPASSHVYSVDVGMILDLLALLKTSK